MKIQRLKMNILFVHNNFPAQYKHLVEALAKEPDCKIAAIGARTAQPMPGVDLHRYDLEKQDVVLTHPFARRFDLECRRAEQVLYTASFLAGTGFRPDIIVVHSGWGENLPLRAIFPKARIISYCEFYYRPHGQDVNFDPEFPELSADGLVALAAKNANGLLALIDCDHGLTPTVWQQSTYPKELQSKISIVHEGVDVDLVRADSSAELKLPLGRVLRAGDEVVTFVSRNLEPLRGYHIFMRAIPRILRERPNAHVVIVGGDQVSYGALPPPGTTWKALYFNEIAGQIDRRRIHFLGHTSYQTYLKVLQISTAHVYLTYPFVLSWSLVEAMSAECNIVASDTAPVRELLDNDSASIVSFFDHAALAAQVVEILRDPQTFRARAQLARAKVIAAYDAKRICVPKLRAFLTASQA